MTRGCATSDPTIMCGLLRRGFAVAGGLCMYLCWESTEWFAYDYNFWHPTQAHRLSSFYLNCNLRLDMRVYRLGTYRHEVAVMHVNDIAYGQCLISRPHYANARIVQFTTLTAKQN